MPQLDTKKIGIVAIISLVLLLIFFVWMGGDLKFPSLVLDGETCPGGISTTVTSLDNVRWNEGSEKWLVEIRAISDAMCLYGQFDASDLIDGEDEALRGFSLSVLNDAQQCRYSLRDIPGRNAMNVEKWVIRGVLWGIGLDKAKKQCYDDPNVINSLGDNGVKSIKVQSFPWAKYDIWCFTNAGEWEGFELTGPSLEWGAKVLFSGGGVSDSKQITSRDLSAISLAGGKVRASWSGNVVGGADCQTDFPSFGDMAIVQRIGVGDKRFVDGSRFNDAQDSFGRLQNDINYANSESEIKSALSTHNSIVAKGVLWDKPFCSSFGECGSISGSRVLVDLNRKIQFPTIKLEIDADIVGIKTQKGGKPSIDSFSCGKISSGSSNTCTAIVRNTGTGAGTYSTSLSCESPIDIGAPSSFTDDINGGSRKTYTFGLSAISKPDLRKTCTLKVCGQRDEGCVEKTTTVDISGGGETCSPTGKQVCSENKAWECASDGEWKIIDDCDKQGKLCEVSGNKAFCKELEKEDVCKNCFSWLQNKIAGEGLCIPKTIFEHKKVWYNPLSWFAPTTKITQDSLCPIMLTIYAGAIIILILGIILIIKRRKR